MEQTPIKEEVHKVAALADDHKVSSRKDLVGILEEISADIAKLQGSIERVHETEAGIRSLLAADEDWAADILGAISCLGNAEKAMQAKAQRLKEAPLLDLLKGGVAIAPIDMALSLVRQMGTVGPDNRQCAEMAKEVMGFLRKSLAALQSNDINVIEVESGTRKLAKALALLYPISQIHELLNKKTHVSR